MLTPEQVDVLLGTEILRNCDRAVVAASFTPVAFRAMDELLVASTTSETLFVVREGLVGVRRRFNAYETVEILGPRGVIGEESLVGIGENLASAWALRHVLAFAANARRLRQIAQHSPEFAFDIATAAFRRLESYRRTVESFANPDIAH